VSTKRKMMLLLYLPWVFIHRQVRFRTPGFHPARPVFISRHWNASCPGVAISTPFVFMGTTFSIFLLCTIITRELTGSTCTFRELLLLLLFKYKVFELTSRKFLPFKIVFIHAQRVIWKY
jgi:hypothetical protein